MNMHYTQWHKEGVNRPSWLHCIPIGMPVRFYLSRKKVNGLIDAIRRNVVERPHAFWQDNRRPLLLVPIVHKSYAPDRAKALKELGTNVKKKTLEMTKKTYASPVGEIISK